METIRKIRLAAHGGGKSIRQIAKDLNLSRNTVRKVLRSRPLANKEKIIPKNLNEKISRRLVTVAATGEIPN